MRNISFGMVGHIAMLMFADADVCADDTKMMMMIIMIIIGPMHCTSNIINVYY